MYARVLWKVVPLKAERVKDLELVLREDLRTCCGRPEALSIL